MASVFHSDWQGGEFRTSVSERKGYFCCLSHMFLALKVNDGTLVLFQCDIERVLAIETRTELRSAVCCSPRLLWTAGLTVRFMA